MCTLQLAVIAQDGDVYFDLNLGELLIRVAEAVMVIVAVVRGRPSSLHRR